MQADRLPSKKMCEGKVAIVTGAAGRGMGRSIALTLAREGACVVVNYLTSADRAQAVVRHILSQGGRAMASPQDIAEAVAYLCSEAGDFISGAVVPFMYRG
jgi:NAD(P)-dependent dehydrogenase (short-subunit alcohol dehydrogenase family)